MSGLGLTKKSPVGGLQLLGRGGRRHPEDLVVRTDASQLAPSLVDIGNLNRARELTGSLRLGSRCTKTIVAHALGVSLNRKEPTERTTLTSGSMSTSAVLIAEPLGYVPGGAVSRGNLGWLPSRMPVSGIHRDAGVERRRHPSHPRQ
jgi:hypothetical protein